MHPELEERPGVGSARSMFCLILAEILVEVAALLCCTPVPLLKGGYRKVSGRAMQMGEEGANILL